MGINSEILKILLITNRLLVGTLALVLISGLGIPAFAEVLTFEFSGVVTSVDDDFDILEGSVGVGTTWSATVEIESDAIDRSQPVGDARGEYRANSIIVQIGGLQFENFSPSDDSEVLIVVRRVISGGNSGFFVGAQDIPQTAGPELPNAKNLDFTVALTSALDQNIFPDDSLPAFLDLDVFELKGMSLFANSGGAFPRIVLIGGIVTSLGDEGCPALGSQGQASGNNSFDLFEQSQDTCPEGDLIVVEFKPVQGIEDVSKLIKNKDTVFKTTIESTFEEDQIVKIQIKENGKEIVSETIKMVAKCKNTFYFPKVDPSHMTEGCGSIFDTFTSGQSIKITTKGDGRFDFILDVDKKITETDETNNEEIVFFKSVEMEKKFKIVYKRITTVEEFPKFPPSKGLAQLNTDASIAYLKNYLPLPQSNVNGKLIDKTYKLRMGFGPDKNGKLTAELEDYLKQLADQNNAAVAVGHFRAGGFINDLTDGAAYAKTPEDGVRNKFVVNIMTTGQDSLLINTGGIKVAHELFHTYDWVSKNLDDGSRHFTKFEKISGFYHPNRIFFDNGNNLMRPAHDFSKIAVPHTESYDFILNTFQSNVKDPPVIYIRGWIADDGTFFDLPWKKNMGFVDLPLGLSSEFAVQYFDSDDNLIAFTGFGTSLIHGEAVTPITFFYNIPDIPGTKKITISQGNILLVEKTISQNAPTVTILEPNGGEIFTIGQLATVKWTSSDIDGDELFHDVLFSTDSGLNWDILALDLPEKEFTFSITDIPGSTDAILKVIASDGINSGEDVSDSSFTISPSTVPVGGEIIPIETTSLILAGAQSFSWMIPVVLSVIGIGLFVVSRKTE